MNEKKLTDDTEIDVGMIVKALECMAGITQRDCDNCPFMIDKFCSDTELSTVTLDLIHLIHRLQSENEELKAKRKKILANKVYSDSTLKKWNKEDLIEQIRILEHNWSCAEENFNNSVKNSEKIFAEQKAEIERLTEEKELKAKNCRYLLEENSRQKVLIEQMKNAYDELQKQVDELTLKNDSLRETIQWYDNDIQKVREQAVKDTAKEILQGFYKWLNQAIHNSYEKSVKGSVRYGGMNTAFHEVKELVEKVAKSKGVEVE